MTKKLLLALTGAVLLAAAATPQTPTATPRPSPTATPTPVPGDLRVSVSVTTNKKKVAGAGAVVWIPGSKKTGAAPAASARISSKNKRFDPHVLAVPKGTTVDFPNLDRIHHNVFSLSETAPFDLGLYKNGASKPWTFEKPG